MATQLQKLMFSIDLLDKVTGPAGRIKKALTGVADNVGRQYERMAGGAMGVASAGASLYAVAAPAHELNMALGEVRSLDVAQASLDALTNKAMEFSVKYGGSSAEVVRSSYDIQSAIAGLKGGELASFTYASAVLAKGTKSDAATITNYMGTMYGIFKNSADAMGKAEWVEQLTGQTATAVQMFKTTGTEMAGAFSSLGANATAAGIAQAEQIAILGSLQATMTGSEAGTKYKAFLAGIGSAQDELGLKFTDSQGKMLGVVDILGKLQSRYGATLEVAESDELKKAFGSDEAVSMVKQLMLDTTGLAKSIDAVGKVKGMDKAADMAEKMVDPLARAKSGILAVSTGLGQALLPALYDAGNAIADLGGRVYDWTQAHPTLTRYIGLTVLVVTALVAGVSAIGIVMALASMAATGFGLAMAIATSPITLTVLAIGAAIAGIVALIYYWDTVKASLGDTAWGRMLIFVLEGVGAVFKFIWDIQVAWLSWLMDFFLPKMETVKSAISAIGDGANWVSEKFGFGDDKAEMPSTSPSLSASKRLERVPGGVSGSIANAVTNNSSNRSNTTYIGQITTNRPINYQDVSSQVLMGS